MCDATPQTYESSEPDNCNLLNINVMMNFCRINDHDTSKNLMQTAKWLAIFDIDYEGLDGGVLTAACPPEALHSLENGLILYCLEELLEIIIPKNAQRQLDYVVQQ